jgi:hypothetical protein
MNSSSLEKKINSPRAPRDQLCIKHRLRTPKLRIKKGNYSITPKLKIQTGLKISSQN